MLADLPVSFKDAAADQLRISFDLAAQPALKTLLIDSAPYQFELRILGTSHQVRLLDVDGQPRFAETVACGELKGPALPGSYTVENDDFAYVMRSEVRRPRRFSRDVQAVLDRCERSSMSLAARFPGDPHAVTALLVSYDADGALHWRTWHAYPQQNELVCTESRLVVGLSDR